MPELAKLVGDADLAVRRPVQRKLDDDRFDLGRRAVLQERRAPVAPALQLHTPATTYLNVVTLAASAYGGGLLSRGR